MENGPGLKMYFQVKIGLFHRSFCFMFFGNRALLGKILAWKSPPQGLEKAKEAVALAPEDPLNWETPGGPIREDDHRRNSPKWWGKVRIPFKMLLVILVQGLVRNYI